MKRKFYDGQRLRVIGADWSFEYCGIRPGGWLFESWFGISAWPEYLLESAESDDQREAYEDCLQ